MPNVATFELIFVLSLPDFMLFTSRNSSQSPFHLASSQRECNEFYGFVVCAFAVTSLEITLPKRATWPEYQLRFVVVVVVVVILQIESFKFWTMHALKWKVLAKMAFIETNQSIVSVESRANCFICLSGESLLNILFSIMSETFQDHALDGILWFIVISIIPLLSGRPIFPHWLCSVNKKKKKETQCNAIAYSISI